MEAERSMARPYRGRLLDSERVNFERRRLAQVPLKDINPAVRDTVVAAEDKRFWSHGGVDWLAMASAVRARWTGGRSRGTSTLPIQLAAFWRPNSHSPASAAGCQLRQMRAGQELAAWTHDQMLEAYLNLVPLRGEIRDPALAPKICSASVRPT